MWWIKWHWVAFFFAYFGFLHTHLHLGLIHTASRAEPNRFGLENKPTLWNGSIHTARRTEPNGTEPDRACSLADVCFHSPADDRFCCNRRPILLRNMSVFLRLKCVCTQKRLLLVNKRLLHQILSINENTCPWFDILAVQKCQLQCSQFGSARLAIGIVTRSARFSSVQSVSARPAVWMRPYVLFLPEGQTGDAWKPCKSNAIFGNRGSLGKKVLCHMVFKE
jgi:hypothetical protein